MTRIPLDPQADDFYEAMRDFGSFVDITPDDARQLFLLAQRHTVARLRASVRVQDLMTSQVITLAPDALIPEAAATLARAGISGAPVTEAGALVGVLSVKDFLPLLGLEKSAPPVALVAGALAGKACPGVDPDLRVRDVMTAPAMTIGPERPASEAARLMAENAIRRLPVLRDGALAGIITHTDIVRSFGDLLEEVR